MAQDSLDRRQTLFNLADLFKLILGSISIDSLGERRKRKEKGRGRGTSKTPSNLVIEREIVSRRRENSFAFSANDLRRPSLILS